MNRHPVQIVQRFKGARDEPKALKDQISSCWPFSIHFLDLKIFEKSSCSAFHISALIHAMLFQRRIISQHCVEAHLQRI